MQRSQSSLTTSVRGEDLSLALMPSLDLRRYWRVILIKQPTSASIPVSGVAHIGVRVHDVDRAVRFYVLLGFTRTAGPIVPEAVVFLRHPSGVEINLIVNATEADETNILMNVPEKHPSITDFALLCPGLVAARKTLDDAGITLSGGPIRFGPDAQAIFVRDPDHNVIELHQRG